MSGIKYEDFTNKFYEWAKDYIQIDKGDWLSIDGKAIKGTLTNYRSSYQEFVSLISVFCEKTGSVLTVGKINNSKDFTDINLTTENIYCYWCEIEELEKT